MGPTRRGVVVIAPDPDGTFSLDYEGGAVIDVDVVGYFTNRSAPTATDGLFVPYADGEVVQGTFAQGVNVVGDLPPYASSVLVNMAAEPGAPVDVGPADLAIASGGTIANIVDVLPLPDGSGRGAWIASSSELDGQVQVLGIFLTGLDR
jgi:hypothetical protein